MMFRSHIIYVNAAYKADTKLGKLMFYYKKIKELRNKERGNSLVKLIHMFIVWDLGVKRYMINNLILLRQHRVCESERNVHTIYGNKALQYVSTEWESANKADALYTNEKPWRRMAFQLLF